MSRTSDRLTGWVFVLAGGIVAVAMVGRAVLGHSAGWWEWPAVTAMCALLVGIGVALIQAEPSPWLVLSIVAGYGLGLVAFGVWALIAPDAVVVTVGRGPRTPAAARIMGAVFVVAGLLLTGVSGSVATRRRSAATTERDQTDG